MHLVRDPRSDGLRAGRVDARGLVGLDVKRTGANEAAGGAWDGRPGGAMDWRTSRALRGAIAPAPPPRPARRLRHPSCMTCLQ